MRYNSDNVNTWPGFKPTIIAHDVGRSHDRSTAVVGGISPCGRRLMGIREVQELPLNLYGSTLASALATVDARYQRNALIVADVSSDPTYGEVLFDTFGPRVIGVHISGSGDGTKTEWRSVRGGRLPVYVIGRTYLLELLLGQLHNDQVRFPDEPTMSRAYDQLHKLEVEQREDRRIYSCAPGHYDDLGISCAMLAWAATHLHLQAWVRNMPSMRPVKKREAPSVLAWT
jgi:hypothetical protein